VVAPASSDAERIRRRLETAMWTASSSCGRGSWLGRRGRRVVRRFPSVSGNAADVVPELVRRGFVPDMVTGQTSAHDTLNGYVPTAWPYERPLLCAQRPEDYTRRVVASIVDM